MNAIERCERRLEKYAGVKPPFTGAKERLLLYLADHDIAIARFEELGLSAIGNARRREMIDKILALREGLDQREVGFNAWLVNEVMGPRTPGSTLLYRCVGCGAYRTYGKVQEGACKCGGRRLNNCIPAKDKKTRIGLKALAYGF